MVVALVAILLTSPKVTLTLPATSVPKAVEQIAKTAGQELFADGSVARDVVCIDVHDVALEDLKTKLAETIGATWIERDGKIILSRPDSLDRQQREEALSARVAEIEKAIDERPALPPYTPTLVRAMLAMVNSTLPPLTQPQLYDAFEKARRQQSAALEQMPARRLLERILKKLDPRQLALLSTDYQVCYSNEPNSSERRLPFDLRPLLAEFRDEQILFQRTATAKDFVPGTEAEDRRFWTYDADPDCKRVLLVIRVDRNSRMPTFALSLLDREGAKSAIASAGLGAGKATYTPALASTPNGRKIPLSPEATEWPQLQMWLVTPILIDPTTHKSFADLLRPWMDQLLNPERKEPLALTASEALIGYAEDRKMPMVALVPDRGLKWPNFGVSSIVCETLPTKIAADWKVETREADGWIIVRPLHLADARAERFDRAALGSFFRRVQGENAVTIDTAASYVIGCKSDMVFETYDVGAPGLAERYQGDYEPRQLTLWYYRALLRLLGHLSPVQRRSLLEGNALTVSQLGSSGKEWMEEFVYSPDMLERIFKRFDSSATDPRQWRGRATDEPWERLPNGIPGSTRIVCTVTEKQVIFTDEGDEHLLSSWTPASFGERLAERAVDADPGTMEFSLGRGKEYDFRFEFTPDVIGTATLRELIPGGRQAYKRPEDLPDSIRQEVLEAFEKEKKRLDARQKQSAGVPPPR